MTIKWLTITALTITSVLSILKDSQNECFPVRVDDRAVIVATTDGLRMLVDKSDQGISKCLR